MQIQEQLLSAKEVVAFVQSCYGLTLDASTVRKWSTRGRSGATLSRVEIRGRKYVKMSRLLAWLRPQMLQPSADSASLRLTASPVALDPTGEATRE